MCNSTPHTFYAGYICGVAGIAAGFCVIASGGHVQQQLRVAHRYVGPSHNGSERRGAEIGIKLSVRLVPQGVG